MPTAVSSAGKIASNPQAEIAQMSILASSQKIAQGQLRIATGKRINSAADDVAGYITSRALQSRNGSLKAALNSTSEAKTVTAMTQDAYEEINSLLLKIKDNAATASTGSLGTDEKVALAKSSYDLVKQIQLTVDSTVFGGKELIKGAFSGDFVVGFTATNTVLTLGIDLTTGNTSGMNISNASEFNINATSSSVVNFAGVSGLDMNSLNSVSSSNLGIFSSSNIATTLTSLSSALTNMTRVTSFVGGVQNRLTSQEDLLKSQITNYNSAIGRIENADVAVEQMEMAKNNFLFQASMASFAQANQNSAIFIQMVRGG